MITASEASYALYGAWRLARADSSGIRYFENTLDAFWRSFYAAVVTLPFYAILVMLRMEVNPPTVGPLTALIVHSIAYVAGWFAFPLAMYYVTGWFDRQQFYFRFIGAYNWASVLQIVLFLVVAVAGALGLVPREFVPLLTLVATLAVLTYQGFVARVGLDVPVWGAAGVVAIDMILSVLLNGYTETLLHPRHSG